MGRAKPCPYKRQLFCITIPFMFHTGKSQFNIEDQTNKKAAYKV
ncbi:hypothetical protein PRABACTJOHN_01681 [Parabacteroides johnsonii DSM 18315]|uniref:Uncharacterized protein n=1 Tax=Parabacteroides johnsonii DSM 18315 TaxID=537006 RepID=B7B9H8_9BACT|nr:hypothetical protein PRABACTJOHN_01681 [Parabacteroides johnsonii DSM 18315]